jgi:hypothetical protein
MLTASPHRWFHATDCLVHLTSQFIFSAAFYRKNNDSMSTQQMLPHIMPSPRRLWRVSEKRHYNIA